jgi:hypothetical protein
VTQPAAVQSYCHAVSGTHDIFAIEERGDLLLREMVDLRAIDHAQARRQRKVEVRKAPFLTIAAAVPAQWQPVARDQRAAVPASEAATQVGGDATEHRFNGKAALDCEIEQGAA